MGFAHLHRLGQHLISWLCYDLRQQRLEKAAMERMRELRKGRKDFLLHMRKSDDRERSMVTDMKHFAQVAHSSMRGRQPRRHSPNLLT